MTEIEVIKSRHSVRSYQDKKIEKEIVEKLQAKIDELNEKGNLHLQFIEDAGNTYNKLINKTMGLGSAPSVIACVGKDLENPDSENSDSENFDSENHGFGNSDSGNPSSSNTASLHINLADLDERVGYYGEQLVLYAQQLGLNTCWAGIFNRKNINAEVADGERLVISIAIGYGTNAGKEHKSRKPEQVVSGNGKKPDWFEYGVEMALLAPTAVNQQKFEIIYDNGEVTFREKGGIFSKVDLGIVKYHFEVGAAAKKL